MRILLVRHAEPDYEHDSLTENGRLEAALLAEKMAGEKIDHFYISPLGRAALTARYTLDARAREELKDQAQTMDFLREFDANPDLDGYPELLKVYPDAEKNPDGTWKHRVIWDMMPKTFVGHPEYFDPVDWRQSEIARKSDLCARYDYVCSSLDQILQENGYRRDGLLYRTEKGNDRTIALYCHFGVSCVILSHLMNVSPFPLWHMTVMSPSSVTEINTEEREKGTAIFRVLRMGDLSHLYAAGRKPSFTARFCSVYENVKERH